MVMRQKKKGGLHHSPTSGDPSYDGNGGTHFSGGHAAAPPLGSTTDLRPDVVASLSGRIWATPWTPAPPSFVGPWCKSNGPKTWFLLAPPRATRGQTVCSGDRPTLGSPWWQRRAWMWPLRSVPPYSSVPWTNHPLAPGPFSIGEKSVPMGGTP